MSLSNPGPRGWLGRFDPLTLPVALVSLVVFALQGFDKNLLRDLAIYSYAGQQFAEGVPPYVGILNRAGPLAHIIPGIGVVAARVVDIDDVLGIRVLFLVISVACVCAMYLLARDLFTSKLAGLAAAAAFLSFTGFVVYAAGGPREKTPMVLFIVCALWAVTNRRWFTAGVFVSLATLTLQIAFFVAMPAALVALLGVARGERRRALARLVVGGLVPLTVCVVYFALVGALRELLDGFLLINLRYTVASPMAEGLAGPWASIQGGYGVGAWVMLAGLVVVAILSLSALRGARRREDPSLVTVAAFGVATVCGLVWTSREYDGWPDVFPLLPFAALGIAGLLIWLTQRLSREAALAATLVWVVAATAVGATYSLSHQNSRLDVQRRAVRIMLAELPPDATILALQAPQPLVLSGKANPTRHLMFGSGLDAYLDATWPGGLAGFGDWIKREKPTLISVGKGVRERYGWLIRPDYTYVGAGPGWTWFAPRSSGPALLTDLRKASERAGAMPQWQ